MDFYTVVLRKSAGYWVVLCLENGLVAQETSKEGAIDKLKEAIESFQMVYQSEENIYNSPVSIKDIHEFLTVEGKEPISEVFELRAVYA
jgi:predicted RNase H-like HicB family nuclease